MKAKLELEFNLPEQETEYLQYMNGPKYACAIHEFFYSSLRNKLKYQELSKEEIEILSRVREEFLEVLQAYQLEI